MRLAYLPLLVAECMPKAVIPLPVVGDDSLSPYVFHQRLNSDEVVQQELGRITTAMGLLGKRNEGRVRMFLSDRDRGCAYSATWNDSDVRGIWDGNDTLEMSVNCLGEVETGNFDTESRDSEYRALFIAMERGFTTPKYRGKMWDEVVDQGNQIRSLLMQIESDVNTKNLERTVQQQEARKKEMEARGLRYRPESEPIPDFSLGKAWSYEGSHVTVRNSDIRLDISAEAGRLMIYDDNFTDMNSILLSSTSGDDTAALVDTEFVFQAENIGTDPIEMYRVLSTTLPILEEFVDENIVREKI
tara:strand:+ start:1999 stop:2901 length:903 start_codon:yes stop_codon:yes gene_type:complete